MGNTATINAKEAAQYMGVSYWLVLDMAKKSLIPCIRAGDRYLFRKETLDKWMDDQEQKTNQSQIEYGIKKIRA